VAFAESQLISIRKYGAGREVFDISPFTNTQYKKRQFNKKSNCQSESSAG
jgi:hypothetical protein